MFLGSLFWTLDALIDYLQFYDLSFWDLLILDVPPHEIYIRITAFIFIVIFGEVLVRKSMNLKKVQDEFNKVEGMSRHVIDNSGIIFISIDVDGNIRLVNRRGLEVFGYRNGELDGLNFHDTLIPQEDRTEANNIFRQVINGDTDLTGYYESPILTKNGSTRIIAWHNSYIRDLHGSISGILCTGDDMTERLAANVSHAEKRRQLATLLSNLPGMAYRCRNDREWTMEFVSDGCLALTGYKSEDIIENKNVSYGELIDVDDQNYVWDTVQAALADKVPFQIEYRLYTANKHVRWVWEQGRGVFSDSGELLALEGFITDVSARKQAHEALRQSEIKFRAIFETAEDGIFLKDSEGRYVTVNPAMEKLFGHTQSEFIGQTDSQLFSEEDAESFRVSDKRVLNGTIVHDKCKININNDQHILDIAKVPLTSGQDTIIGVCGIARDITEMNRLQELSGRAQRLETAGRIAGQVAHDFNNLLGPLMAYPEIMKEELPADHPILQYIDDIEHSAQQIAEINTQLLTLGRRGQYTQEIININELIRQVCGQLFSEQSKVKAELLLQDDVLNVKGGASQINRMINNLAANAKDALNGEGVVTITTENYYADQIEEGIDDIPRGEYIKMSITDNGVGIAPEILDKVYDPFFTTKTTSRTKGSGLGLSVVHSVVKDHGGVVRLESELGRGTTFTIYLPATREEIPLEVKNEKILGGAEKVLVVDDDKTQREVAVKLLERLGYDVWTIDSGEQALELLHSNTFDLLILDIIMPLGINGVETYRRALQIHPNQRAIAISGFAESKLVEEILELGAGQFINKPLNIQRIAEAVRRELDREQVT